MADRLPPFLVVSMDKRPVAEIAAEAKISARKLWRLADKTTWAGERIDLIDTIWRVCGVSLDSVPAILAKVRTGEIFNGLNRARRRRLLKMMKKALDSQAAK